MLYILLGRLPSDQDYFYLARSSIVLQRITRPHPHMSRDFLFVSSVESLSQPDYLDQFPIFHQHSAMVSLVVPPNGSQIYLGVLHSQMKHWVNYDGYIVTEILQKHINTFKCQG